MASVFEKSDQRPIPEGAERFTRKHQALVRFKTKRGRTQINPVCPDDPNLMLVRRRCWYICYVDEHGKRRTVKGFADKAASEQKGRDLERKAQRRKSGLVDYDDHAAGKTVKEAVEAWTADLARQGKSAGYVYNMKLLMTKMREGCNWPTLGSIRSDSLQTWLAGMTHLSARSSNQYIETARALLNWCCAQKPPWLLGNPLANVEPADEVEKRREKRALTLDELARLKAVSGRRWVIYLTAALTGLRRSELRRLQWGDVRPDHERPHILLRASATKAKREDVVALNPELLEVLRALRPADAVASARVFPRIPKYATYKKDVTERAEIPWRDEHNRLASFHCLRKTFATYLALADVPLRVAMDMMRVTDAKLLHGVYTDARLFNTSEAANRLPRLHKPDEQAQPPEQPKGKETA